MIWEVTNWYKCLPFVGTYFSARECLRAVYYGRYKVACLKLLETAVDAYTDFLIITTGGLLTPWRVLKKQGLTAAVASITKKHVNAVGCKVVEGAVVDTATTIASHLAIYYDESTSTGNSGQGNGNNNPNEKKSKGDHERDVGGTSDNPILDYELGPNGRVQFLSAKIQYRHLRKGPRGGRGYTNEVEAHVHSLNFCHGAEGCADGDQVGHIIGDALGGPSDKLYNFFPQGGYCNTEQYHRFEKLVINFLERQHSAGNDGAFVAVYFDFYYPENSDSNRPYYYKIYYQYSDGTDFFQEVFRNI